ncbi:hypothetical protein FDECE_4433 [Fusarium decemcellulare]|nr:hypothetical protein FDECE_4433 [Fusarium decemcellulare]
MSPYTIPQELASQLELVENPDTRSFKEIITALNHHVPVTSEKNIWAFWHDGLDAMPGWCQRNVVDWVRICGPSWTVRVLDVVPGSPNHALNFASKDLLPDALDRVCWDEIADPKSPIEVAVPIMYAQTIANHFVASSKGNPFIEKWHKLFLHLWEGRNNHSGLIAHPALAFAKDLDFSEAADWKWDFKPQPHEVLEYISQVMCWRRLTMIEDTGDGFNGSQYWQEKILGIDPRHENWAAEDLVGFASGARLYTLFNLPLNTDPQSEDYKQAYKLVWLLLSSASWQKVTHGKGMTHAAALGTLWDENDGKDSEPGTFGELLRWGSVHLRQKRESISLKEPVKSKLLLQEGLFGP